MAENDIYNSKERYEYTKNNLHLFGLEPRKRKDKFSTRVRYYCKNRKNLEYFRKLFPILESKDTSYVRRNRLLNTFRMICYAIDKDLVSCEREDINKIVAYMHTVYLSPKTKADFIRDIKYLWKLLFTEKDERGQLDETIVPYVVRHLSARIDKSKEKLRNDRITWEEFEKILNYFSNDVRMQAYLFLSLESLGRPQEILYTKIKDVEIYDNYAKVFISEHGKEGTGFLQCIDSFPYVSRWFNQHPLKHDKNAYFFISFSDKTKYGQFKNKNINSILQRACKNLGIDKSITAYSLKRNGVTFRRLRGDSDVEIQHAARWSSTKQLKTYDMSKQEDAFKMELVKRGMINDEKFKHLQPKVKICMFCDKHNGVTNAICYNCKRPLDRSVIRKQEKEKEQIHVELKSELESLREKQKEIESVKDILNLSPIQDLFRTVSKLQEEIQTMKR